MYCEKCGQQLRDDAKFCNKCGAPVTDEKSKTKVSENRDQPEKESKKNVSENSQSSKHFSSQQSTKKRIPLWIKIVCGVLILSIVAGGVILALYLSKAGQSSTENKSLTELASIEDLPGDFEKELGLFYYYDSKRGETLDEHYYEERSNFDCENPDTYHDYLIESLMPPITPIRLQLYPGENTEPAEKGPDPLDQYSGASFCRVPYDKIVWVAQNIFHIPQDKIDDMITYVCDNTDIYIYDEAEKKYLINRYDGSEGFNAEKQYKKILTDGTKYYLLIEYDLDKTKNLPTETYYVEASYENIDGKNYWTLFRHTLDVPDSMKEYMKESSQTKTDQPKTEKNVVITDVDPSELPESLKDFLILINYGFHSDDDSQYHREFDSSNLKSCYNTFVGCVAKHGSCVDLPSYPFYDYKEDWTHQSDPLGKIEKMGYVSFTKEQIIWVMKYIFHVSDNEIDGMFEAAYSSEDYLYEYETDGTKRLYNWLAGIGGSVCTVSYENVRFDGEKYYIVYSHHTITYVKGVEPQKFYAEVSEVEYEGKKYWSLYRNTETIPDLPKITDTSSNADSSDADSSDAGSSDAGSSDAGSSEADSSRDDSSADNNSADNISEWSNIYRNFIINKNYLSSTDGWLNEGSLRKRIEENTTHPVFYLYDLNNDKTPELFMSFGYIGGSTPHNVYTVNNGKLEFLSNIIPGGELLIYNSESDNHGLFCGAGRQGSYAVQYWYMNGDQIDRKDVLTEKAKNIAEFSEGFDLTIHDQNLYDTFMDCTKESDYGPATSFRVAKSSLPARKQTEIESIGWDSYISEYGY